MRAFRSSRARFRTVLLAACIAAGPNAARAQSGDVTGSVVDAQGLALPGVLIEIRTGDGDRAGSGVTDRNGAFTVARIEAGAYRLTADLIGFETYEATIDVGPDGADVAATLAIRPFSQALTVTGMMPDVATEQVVPARRIEQRVAQDLALSLREQPGVTALRRGAVNLDPAVRGLYAEQIGVFVDGTRTFAAGPARMDSGLSHVSPHALQSVRVVRGPFALTWGAGTLSAIRAETFRPAFADGDFRLNGRAGYNHGSNGSANDGFAGLWGSNGRIRFTFQHNTRSGGDYADGNGDVVPGDYDSYDTRWSLGGRLNERTLIEYSGGHQQQSDLDYPGRILDATFFTDPVARGRPRAHAGRRADPRDCRAGVSERQGPPDEQRRQADGAGHAGTQAAVRPRHRPAGFGRHDRGPVPRRPRPRRPALEGGRRRVQARAVRRTDDRTPEQRQGDVLRRGLARRAHHQHRRLRAGRLQPGGRHHRRHPADRPRAGARRRGLAVLRRSHRRRAVAAEHQRQRRGQPESQRAVQHGPEPRRRTGGPEPVGAGALLGPLSRREVPDRSRVPGQPEPRAGEEPGVQRRIGLRAGMVGGRNRRLPPRHRRLHHRHARRRSAEAAAPQPPRRLPLHTGRPSPVHRVRPPHGDPVRTVVRLPQLVLVRPGRGHALRRTALRDSGGGSTASPSVSTPRTARIGSSWPSPGRKPRSGSRPRGSRSRRTAGRRSTSTPG